MMDLLSDTILVHDKSHSNVSHISLHVERENLDSDTTSRSKAIHIDSSSNEHFSEL